MTTPSLPDANRLDDDAFLAVISNTPLVSIDLVLTDAGGAMLLGRRLNEPARGSWFVPGGRIYKDESLDQAFARICLAELRQPWAITQARLLGAYTHRYDSNAFSVPGITTHYVVLAYHLEVAGSMLDAMAQHSAVRWFTPEEADPELGAGADPEVHENVLPYFRALTRGGD